MPYYAGLRREAPEVRKRIAAGLLRIRESVSAQNIPEKTTSGDVLIASWNIREFDSAKYGGRLPDAIYFIAEILSNFDLIAIQEVRENLDALERVQNLLGSWWKYIVTDVTEGASGNGERMAFLFDTRKVTFGGLAGEIVLPPQKVDSEVLQFARTPFVCGFKAGWAKVDLCTVHIYYGKGVPIDNRRLEEIQKFAAFMAKRAKSTAKGKEDGKSTAKPQEPNTTILLGDFNIFNMADETLKAITDAGFKIPKTLLDRSKGSNLGKDKFYDQIAIWRGKRFAETPRGGVFDFYEAVFREADAPEYEPLIQLTKSGSKPRYKEWKTYQMSDHLVLWSAFQVDYAREYLEELSSAEP
jgi:endonuclease/exonuclease/phosphatase family metal-dependent hydrolase